MSLWGCVFLAVFCAYAISTGDAVKCFECNSETNPSCGDPFYYSNLPLIDCERKNQYQPQSQTYTGSRSVCKKTKTRVNGYYVVDRSCALEENYGLDPCGGNRGGNFGYRDSNSAYQSSYPNNYGQSYGNNYGQSQNPNYGGNYGNNYGSNNYGSSYGGYGQDHCSTCRYDACNGAAGVAPTLLSFVVSALIVMGVKSL